MTITKRLVTSYSEIISKIVFLAVVIGADDLALATSNPQNMPQTQDVQSHELGATDGHYGDGEAAEWRPLTSVTTDHLRPGETRVIESEEALASFLRMIQIDPHLENDPLLNSKTTAGRILDVTHLDFDKEVVVAAVSSQVTWCNRFSIGIRTVNRVKAAYLRLTVAREQYSETECRQEDYVGYPRLGRYGIVLIGVKRPVAGIEHVRLITRIVKSGEGVRDVDDDILNEEPIQ